jgi:hypothetical protein
MKMGEGMKRGLAVIVCLALIASGISMAFVHARAQEPGLIVTIFEDDFEDNDAEGWIQSHADGASCDHWRVLNGEYLINDSADLERAEPHHFSIADNLTVDDFELTLRTKLDERPPVDPVFFSSKGHELSGTIPMPIRIEIGSSFTLFRYQDTGNFYALNLRLEEEFYSYNRVESHCFFADALCLFAFPSRIFAGLHIPNKSLWISLEKREDGRWKNLQRIQLLDLETDFYAWYRVRIQVTTTDPATSETGILVKVWKDNEAEPADWMMDVTDSTNTFPDGKIGVMAGLNPVYAGGTVLDSKADSGVTGETKGVIIEDPVKLITNVRFDDVKVTIRNAPPVADAGSDQSVEAELDGYARVFLDGSASFDPDDDPITHIWMGPFPEQELGADLIAHWQFEENADDSVNGHHGGVGHDETEDGGPPPVWGPGDWTETENWALHLDGRAFVLVPYHDDLNLVDPWDGFSISAWIKIEYNPPVESRYVIVSHHDAGSGYCLYYYNDPGPGPAIVFQVYDANGCIEARAFFGMNYTGEWRHVVGRLQITEESKVLAEVYVMGERGLEYSERPLPFAPTGNALDLCIGAAAYDTCLSRMQGALDEVRLYRRALTDLEIRAMSFRFGLVHGEQPSITLPEGIHPVDLIVEDTYGARGCDSVDITVLPANKPPTAHAVVVLETDTQNGALATLDGRQSSDPEGDPLTYKWTIQGLAGDPPHSDFIDTPDAISESVFLPLGEYTVTLVVHDGNYDSDPDTIRVSVTDGISPVITAPEDISLEATTYGGVPATNTSIQGFLAAAEVADVCDPNPIVSCDAPDFFGLGPTTVTWTAEDQSGNKGYGSATVTVVDTTCPVITAPGDITLEATTFGGASPTNTEIQTFLAAAEVADVCDPNPIVSCDAPDFFGLGPTTVTWTAEDQSGNKGYGSATVTVVDTTPPEIDIADRVEVEATCPAGIAITDEAIIEFLASAVVTDLCDPDPQLTFSVSGWKFLPLGDNTVTLEAKDDSGNSRQRQVVIAVVDTTPPVIDIADGVVVEATGPYGAERTNRDIVLFLESADVFDQVDPAPQLDVDLPEYFPLGKTSVTLTATDHKGNTSKRTVFVEVVDTTAPVIYEPEDIIVEATASGGAPADHPEIKAFLNGVTAEDLYDPHPVITNDAPNFFPLGRTSVTFTARDSENNQSYCAAWVTVVDTTPPHLDVFVKPGYLWPPNHKLVRITPEISIEDIADPNPSYKLLGAESNQPDEVKQGGDGNASPDIVIEADGTIWLRAERQGKDEDRIYTLTWLATDSQGNEVTVSVPVIVPHDMKSLKQSKK